MGPILDPAGRAHSRRNPTAREDPGIQHDPEHKNAYQYEKFHQTILSVYGQISSAIAVTIRSPGVLYIDVGQSFSLFKEVDESRRVAARVLFFPESSPNAFIPMNRVAYHIENNHLYQQDSACAEDTM